MQDNSIPISQIVTFCLWVITLTAFAAAWTVWFVLDEWLAVMIATTAVVPLAAAALSHIRCYTLRICRLIRSNAELLERTRQGGEVRSMR